MIQASKITNAQEKLDAYVLAIKMTIPKFEITKINEYLLSHTEISIINGIACCYKKMNQNDLALDIFNKLAFYIDTNITSLREKIRNQTLILSNLTNLLLLNKKYIDVLYWTDKGIDLCLNVNDSYFLPILYYAKCKANLQINKIDEAKRLFIYTYSLLKVNGQETLANIICEDLKKSADLSFTIHVEKID